jgi:hypothetical protein
MDAPKQPADRSRETAGWWLLLIGGILAVPGMVLMFAFDSDAAQVVGITMATFGTLPTLVGLGLLVINGISRRADADKPFA